MADRSDMHKKMKARNYVLAGVLLALAIFFAVVTFVKFEV